MGSAFRIGSLRVVTLKPCWTIELPASEAEDAYELSVGWPFTAIVVDRNRLVSPSALKSSMMMAERAIIQRANIVVLDHPLSARARAPPHETLNSMKTITTATS